MMSQSQLKAPPAPGVLCGSSLECSLSVIKSSWPQEALCEGMITMFHNLIGIHELIRCNDAKTLEVSKF